MGHLRRRGDPDSLLFILATSAELTTGEVWLTAPITVPSDKISTCHIAPSALQRDHRLLRSGSIVGESPRGITLQGWLSQQEVLGEGRKGALSYLVTVHRVLRCPRGNGDGIWLAASIPLAVSILHSIPAGRRGKKQGWGWGEPLWVESTQDFQLGWQSRASALSSRDLSKTIPLKGAALCDFQ